MMHNHQADLFSPDFEKQLKAVQAACRSQQVAALPSLLLLLNLRDIGYFVEESLHQFGPAIVPTLCEALARKEFNEKAKHRIAIILAYFGEYVGVPLLLEAMDDIKFGYKYYQLLAKIEPEKTIDKLVHVIQSKLDILINVENDADAVYFYSIIWVIEDTASQDRLLHELERIMREGKHWLVQASAARALYEFDPHIYGLMIKEIAINQQKPLLLKIQLNPKQADFNQPADV